MLIIAIDPGLSGAIAFLDDEWVLGKAKVLDLPTVDLDTGGTVKRRVHGPRLQQLILENVPDGAVDVHFVIEALSTGGRGTSSPQTIGSQYRTRGSIEAVVECMGLRANEVYAQTWKRFYGLVGKQAGAEQDQAKRAREIASGLFPAVGPQLRRACDHNRAEAILIGNWYLKKGVDTL